MEATLTPWEVKGKVNYMAQINKFGTSAVDTELVKRWEKVTKMKAHRFIRRGLVFSHQDIELILDDVEAGRPVYIYTGRGPSSESMHLGHMVPFLFTKYLQDALNCIVVIQMSDEEKYFFKDGSGPRDLESYRQLGYKNARDVIACGFDLKKTFIFSDLEFNCGNLFFNNCLLMKATTMNQIQGIYGLGSTVDQTVVDLCKRELLTEHNEDKIKAYNKIVNSYDGKESSNTVGQCIWPCFQCGPSYCTSFSSMFIQALEHSLLEGREIPEIVKNNMRISLEQLKKSHSGGNIRCLVPMAIDQAPYFRLARDVAHVIECPKPAVVHSEFLPGLKQDNDKMSSTGGEENATLFLDMTPEQIAQTIKKHAFSGGRETKKDHEKYGGNIGIDISYQYLTFFLESDEELRNIAERYTQGELLSNQLKTLTANLISDIIREHQQRKSEITEDVLLEFFNYNRVFDIGGCYGRSDLESVETYTKGAGLDYDRTFGLKPTSEP